MASIVDYLKSVGQDSSYAARKKLADQYGIKNYSGTASQNISLLNSLKSSGGSPSGSQGTVQPAQNQQNTANGNNVTITPVDQSSPGNPASQYLTGYSYKKYTPSDRTQEYADKLADLEDDAPGSFHSRYDEQIQNIINTIQNRPEFEADSVYESDLWKNYRDQYVQAGNKAMRDTMGNAANLTGGYGSTYAQAAGQQAYDAYLNQLGDRTLDIYDRLYNEYLNEGQELYNQLNMYNNQDSIDYGRYRDEVSDYYNALNYYSGRYNQEYANDFGDYQYDQDAQRWAEEYAYQKTQDALAQQNWQTQFDYQKDMDERQYQLQLQQLAASRARGSSGGSSSKKSSKSSELDEYVEMARQMLNGEYKGNGLKYSSQNISQILYNYHGLSQEEAAEVVGLAGGSASAATQYLRKNYTDSKATEEYYDMAKDYAKNHEDDETFDYVNNLYENNRISAKEAEEIYIRLGIK